MKKKNTEPKDLFDVTILLKKLTTEQRETFLNFLNNSNTVEYANFVSENIIDALGYTMFFCLEMYILNSLLNSEEKYDQIIEQNNEIIKQNNQTLEQSKQTLEQNNYIIHQNEQTLEQNKQIIELLQKIADK